MTDAPPAPTEALVEQAVRLHKSGRPAEAEQLYRRALAAWPQHPEANHNLGILLLQRGAFPAGVSHFKAALEADTSRDLYWLSYARAQLIAGHPRDAAATLDQARSRGLDSPAAEALLAEIARAAPPDDAEALLRKGDRLAEAGQLDRAVEAYRQAVSLDPALHEAHYHLGSVLSETGRVAEGFAHFMRRAELVRGGDDPTAGGAGPPHKVKHDREQRAYLARRGLVAPDAPPAVFHLGDGARIDGAAVDPANATPALLAQWDTAAPQMVVLDDFLTPPALDRLRAYCAESTVWRRIYDAGYIGATPRDGFACPLLAQIVEEVAATYSAILARQPFRYLGAFKYDSELSTGTNTHADLSAVNVNLYIAPDEANLDPDSGGMVVWDVEAADEAEMRRLNSNEAELRAHLERRGARAIHVAHRANRVVIFRSSLFHKTDACNFRDGYLNMRINVSLLFGDFRAEP